MKRFLAGAMAGAAAMYLLDPDRGRARRARMSQQLAARKRRIDRVAEKAQRDAANRAQGAAARAHGAGVFHPTDDRALEVHLHQVIEELDTETRDVTVEAVDGIVRLRGQVSSTADIARVVQAVNGVPGVHAVESFLHLPGEPAPNKEAALRVGTNR
jgi:hypothetical protein